ncbi:MAG: hypothetical protein U0353_23740 [Sandaracinus sp.]
MAESWWSMGALQSTGLAGLGLAWSLGGALAGDIECHFQFSPLPSHRHEIALAGVVIHHPIEWIVLALLVGHVVPLTAMLVRRRPELSLQLVSSFLELLIGVMGWMTIVSERVALLPH